MKSWFAGEENFSMIVFIVLPVSEADIGSQKTFALLSVTVSVKSLAGDSALRPDVDVMVTELKRWRRVSNYHW